MRTSPAGEAGWLRTRDPTAVYEWTDRLSSLLDGFRGHPTSLPTRGIDSFAAGPACGVAVVVLVVLDVFTSFASLLSPSTSCSVCGVVRLSTMKLPLPPRLWVSVRRGSIEGIRSSPAVTCSPGFATGLLRKEVSGEEMMEAEEGAAPTSASNGSVVAALGSTDLSSSLPEALLQQLSLLLLLLLQSPSQRPYFFSASSPFSSSPPCMTSMLDGEGEDGKTLSGPMVEHRFGGVRVSKRNVCVRCFTSGGPLAEETELPPSEV